MIDELGIEPGERLQQLEHAILTSDPSLGPPAEPIRIQPAKQASGIFRGMGAPLYEARALTLLSDAHAALGDSAAAAAASADAAALRATLADNARMA